MASPEPAPAHLRAAQIPIDALTRLPGGGVLSARLEQAILHAPAQPLAVLVLGLDRFRHVNELLGYDAGDQALCLAAERLRQWAPPGASLSRLGGDLFAAVLPACGQSMGALSADALIGVLRAPATVASRDLFLGASVGLSLYPGDGTTAPELLGGATRALRRAKLRGGGVLETASSAPGLSPERRYLLESALRRAVHREEFVLRYQPQTDRDGRLCGLEALITWPHHQLGLVDTAMFIQLAEEIGVISAIGEWVLRRASRQIRRWLDLGLNPPRVAVNVSPLQFSCPRFVTQVRSILESASIPGSAIELEITEGTILRDLTESAARMAELRALGVRIAIDDFGVGYSPLAYLNELPLDVVKIDRSFIGQITHPSGSLPVVHTITVLAHQRGLSVVAEGVETQAELDLVFAARCDAAQGYFISRPLTPAQVATFAARPLNR